MQSNALFSVRIQHSQNCCVKQNHLPVCPNFSIQWLQDYFHNDSFSFFFSQLELNTFEAPILCMWVLCCLPCFSVPGPCAPVPPGASQQSAPYAALRCSYYQSRINERQKTNPAMDDWVQHELQAANTQPKQFTIGKQSDMQKKADIWWTAAVMAHIWLFWKALGHRCTLLCGIGMACCELSGGNPFIILTALNPLHRVSRCILMPSRSVPDSSIPFDFAY